MATFSGAPSVEDLYGLYSLCGSEHGVVTYLAKLYGLTPDEIAPTVHGWLESLPAVPPPSRQRSAPPVLNPALEARLAHANPRSTLLRIQPPDVMRIEVPQSAPCGQNLAAERGQKLVAAMRALESRMNNSTGARAGPNARRAVPELHRPGFHVVGPSNKGLPSVEEEAVVDYMPAGLGNKSLSLLKGNNSVLDQRDHNENEELANYLQRSRLVHGNGRLAPTVGGGKEVLRSTWMTGAVKPAAVLLRK